MIIRLQTLALISCLFACAAPSSVEGSRTRVAACQILVDGDREAAFDRIDRALQLAAGQGADIACFPEACLFGWVNPDAHALAHPIPGETTERLGQLARKHKVLLALGLAEAHGEQLHNAAVLIDSDGSLLAHHRKVNILSELMDPPYTPGGGATASFADTRFGRIGLLICADTFKDEILSQLSAAQPDIVLVPFGWAAPEEAWPEHGESLHAWIAHTARSTGAPTLGVDSVGAIGHGPWTGQILGGQSAFSDTNGAVSSPLADREVEVRVFELPSDFGSPPVE